jgi:glycogen debranching enzyme
VACAPQAWAAGAVFMTLQACLGLSINAVDSNISISYAALPESLQRVEIRNLMVGPSRVDFAFERYAGSVGVNIMERTGPVEIMARK